jgi:hypothetical protein
MHISLADALANPGTVVIQACDAHITMRAVSGSWSLVYLTHIAIRHGGEFAGESQGRYLNYSWVFQNNIYKRGYGC